MRPHLVKTVMWLGWMAMACGGRSNLEESGVANAPSSGSFGTQSGGTAASSLQNRTGGETGGTIETSGGTRASAGTIAGSGGITTAGTSLVALGGRTLGTGGVHYATGGTTTTGSTPAGRSGGSASGGAAFAEGGTSSTAGASKGGSNANGGSSNQGGVTGSGGAVGGVTATGGATDIAASSGGTTSGNTSSDCPPDRVFCGIGAATKCVDFGTDPEHCGRCGNACAKGAACISGACELARCQQSFGLGGIPTIATDRSATALVIGDFNQDGHLDIATANDDANSVSALLGDGKGAFAERTDHATGRYPVGIAIGDFNRDGDRDLVTANFEDDSVSVLIGKGDGTFESAMHYPVADGPAAVAVDDFDGDGIEDIATANRSAGTVSILYGSDKGTFVTKVDYAAGSFPTQLLTGDFNQDGNRDLITNGGPSTANVLLGAGSGTFIAASPIPSDAGVSASRLALGDLNRDGKQDLIVATPNGRYSSGTLGVLFGIGDGSFLSMAEYGPGAARVVASGDLNRDGNADLVYSGGGQTLSILSIDADGSPAEESTYPTPAPPEQVVIGDFNDDNLPDVATLDQWGIYILIERVTGGLDYPSSEPVSSTPQNLSLSDLDGDGHLDLALLLYDLSTATASVSVQLGRGNGAFASSSEFPTRYGEDLIEAGDLDGNGTADLVTASGSESGVSVLWDATNTGYSSQMVYATEARADFLALGDLNHDGRQDILVASADYLPAAYSLNVLLNQGNGIFTSTAHHEAASWWTLALADVNHDGNLDLVQTSGEQNGLAVRLGLGDGTFATPTQATASNGSVANDGAVVGDLDGDGNLDLVSPDMSTTYLDVLLGAGDGTFRALAPQLIAENYGPGKLALGDLNGDGKLDVVSNGLVPWVGYQIVVMLGSGDGTFTCATASLVGAGQERFGLGDVNGDSRPDLVVPYSDSKSFTVLLNRPL